MQSMKMIQEKNFKNKKITICIGMCHLSSVNYREILANAPDAIFLFRFV